MAEEAIKAVVRRYFEVVHNERNVAVIEQILSPALSGPTSQVVTRTREAFPDYRITIDHQIAEGDIVATVWTLSGTHRGVWHSPIGEIDPTEKRVSYTGSSMFRVVGGKISEVLGTNHDHLGLLQQMGALPAIAPRPGA